MNKDKWKNRFNSLIQKLRFLKEEDPDSEDEILVEEKELSSGSPSERDLPEGDLREKLARNRRFVRIRRIAIVVLIVLVAGGFTLYNRTNTFSDYVIVDSYENKVAAGSKYESVGKNIYRYSSDGISCVSRKNELNGALPIICRLRLRMSAGVRWQWQSSRGIRYTW